MSVPAADLQSLAEELDEECARELAAAFLEDSATAITGIDAAISTQNADELKAHAHGLKGCCRTIKAAAAEQVCTEFENAAINKDWAQVNLILPRLAAAYREVCIYIKTYLGN